MTEIRLTEDQIKAITSLDGPLFVAAGAGSGKTGVVTRRFVHAIATGRASVDQILTITFTKKAAAEMMIRIRHLLRNRWVLHGSAGEAQFERMGRAYRQIERAQISTIDSFCASLLRAHALAAGIDPDFKTLDQSQALVVREEAFDACLKRFVEKHGAAATGLISAYDPNRAGDLFNAIAGVYDRLRSQGCEPALPAPKIRIAEAEERLRAAIAGVRAAVGALDSPSGTQLEGLDQAALLESALNTTGNLARYRLATDAKLKKKGSYTRAGEEFGELAGARDFFLNEIRSLQAEPALGLIKDLLEMFAGEYEAQKHKRGSLDFGDLSVKSRDLLRENENVRLAVASRYQLIMVDEFQDTNELQYHIVNLIANNNLCLVGDENQSIYGFRDAVVELFQQRKDEAKKGGYLVELAHNYRSQPELLSFVDHIFDRKDMLQPGYLKLTPSANPDGRQDDQRVEIVFVDERRKSKNEGLEKVPKDIAIKAEAHIIAQRLKDLSEKGYEIGGMAVLVRKAGQADIYRDALRRIGIESYLAVGRSYFEKLELGDVINMLRLIINPFDDLALIGALRSCMAAVSDDALYWLRQAARDSAEKPLPLFSAIARAADIAGLRDEDRARLNRFVTGLTRLRNQSRRDSLEAVCRRILNFNDFAAIIAARPGGKQKLANLMKLLDMSSDFEESWGSDLPMFTEFLERQKRVEAKEAEAPTEEEGIKAVRFLTMHGAKGLEFPLVVLPDLGVSGGGNSKIILVDRHGGRVGLKYIANSLFDGHAFEYDSLAEENRQAELREEKRLGYVAMTRARGHLLVSGVAPADKPPTADKKSEPPFDWLRKRLPLCWPRDDSLGEIDCLEDVNGAQVGVHLCVDPEAMAAEFDRAAAGFTEKPLEDMSPGIVRIPPPVVYMPATISPTAIDTFVACPRRYYLEAVLSARDIFDEEDVETWESGLSRASADPETSRQWPLPDRHRKPEGVSVNGLSSRHMGILVHALLERARPPLAGTAELTDEYLDKIASIVLPAEVRLAAIDRRKAACLVANLGKTRVIEELNRAAVAGTLSRELSFSTMLGRTILKGQIDALAGSDRGSLVVDYKTGDHGRGKPTPEAAAAYKNQMAAYALATFRMKPAPVEVVLVFLDDPVGEISTFFTEAHIDNLERELKEKVKSMSNGRFTPVAAFDRDACSLCVGNNAVAPLCPTVAAARRA